MRGPQRQGQESQQAPWGDPLTLSEATMGFTESWKLFKMRGSYSEETNARRPCLDSDTDAALGQARDDDGSKDPQGRTNILTG